jgi:serine/threonine-protein kinase RsbW
MSESSEETLSKSPAETPAAAGDTAQSIMLPARFENLDRVREFVALAAEAYELDSSAVYSVQLAVDEAFTNIIEHAYGGECLENNLCTCQTTPDGLVITLKDCGKPFNPQGVPEPNLQANLEDRELGGLGLYFIRQLMDEVSFTFVPATDTSPGCNILRMVKRKEK